MPHKVELGMQGQRAAEDFLQGKGWRVLERNFRSKTGEIDLIGQDGAYVVFVEVKYRGQLKYGFPRESVNHAKQLRIKKTAMYYIVKHKLNDQDFRFDVVEVYNEDGHHNIEHIENAFS
jgi:putative endonuclease